jgi:hypothetical protein
MMYKTVTVSFRTKRKLMELLDRMSRKSGCSRSSLIEAVLHSVLTGKADSGFKLENRVEIKGMEPFTEEDGPPEDVSYVTVGGVRVGLPKNRQCRISFDERQSVFQLDFTPGQGSGSEVLPSSGKEGDWIGHSIAETDSGRIFAPSTENRK